MAIIEIPTRNDLDAYEFKIDLDAKTYGFDIQWNPRSERWYLTVLDSNDAVLLSGLALTVNSSLIRRFANPLLPPGRLFLLDTSERGEECGRGDLGSRCLLLYEEAL